MPSDTIKQIKTSKEDAIEQLDAAIVEGKTLYKLPGYFPLEGRKAAAAEEWSKAILRLLESLFGKSGPCADYKANRDKNGWDFVRGKEIAADTDELIDWHLEWLGDLVTEVKKWRPTQKAGGVRVFISHRHKDKSVVSALVAVLEAAFDLHNEDLRVTSVPPYDLRGGADVRSILNGDLAKAKAVLGVITPDTKASTYVMFELGAAWGQNIETIPLLVHGATLEHLPDPLQGIHALVLGDESGCHKLLDDLAKITKLKRRRDVGGAVAIKVKALAKEASEAR